MDSYNSDQLQTLHSCKKDAEDIVDVLRRQGYHIFGSSPLIGSFEDYKDGWIKVRKATIDFFSDAKPSQTLLFYFSGHGLVHKGEIYLTVTQTDVSKPSFASLSLSEITRLMSESKSREIVGIIDACYSGTINLPKPRLAKGESELKARVAIPHYDKIWKKVTKNKRISLLLSSQEYEVSYSTQNSNSLYTKYILEGLNGVKFQLDETGRRVKFSGTVDDNGQVITNLLHDYVYFKVANEERQVPEIKQKGSSIILAEHPNLATTHAQNLNQDLLLLLVNGRVSEFNNRRREDYNVSVDLHGTNLAGAKLTNIDLSEVNLREASLEGSSLEYANLYGVSLMGGNLTRANLTHASLRHANLEEANFTRANLQYTYLNRADLRFADLTNSILVYANLQGCDLSNTIVEGANMYGVFDSPITEEEAISRGAVFRPISRSGSGVQNPS